MNLSIGLSLTRPSNPLGAPAFNPASLFASGEEGAWYDPSDLTTLYQDAAGTTSAGAGDPVGLMLDKSKGLTLGSNVVVNGTFDTNSDWNLFSSWAIASGYVENTTGGTDILQPSAAALTVGKWYRLDFDLTATGGNTYFRPNAGGSAGQVQFTTPGSKTVIFQATALFFGFRELSGVAGTIIDNVVIRELPGNHATQSTSTARPTLAVTGTTPATLGSELSSYTGGVFNGSATGATLIATATAGVAYRVSYEVLSGTATTVLITPTGGSSVSAPASVGTHEVVVYGAGSSLRFGYTNAVNLSVGPVSVKEVLTWADPKYYLDFDGVDDWVRTTFGSTQAQPNTISAAFKLDVASGLQFLIDSVPAGRNVIYQNALLLNLFANSAIISSSATGTAERVALGHLNSTSSSLRLDGVQVATGDSGSAAWGGITLGASASDTSPMNGRIYGFIGVNRTLAAGEIDGVESYLAAKSGVTL